jgi:hypothetical protein
MKNFKAVCFDHMKKVLIFCILTFIFSIISAQEYSREAPPLRERLFYGGNFSLQLGSITNIEVDPIIGLWIRPRLAVALGPNYSYYKDFYQETNIFGGRAYVQYVVFRDLNNFIPLGTGTSLFIHLEDEMLSLDSRSINVTATPRFVVNSVLSGVGLSQQIGRRASVNIMFLWTISESGPEMPFKLHSSPDIRIGFVF